MGGAAVSSADTGAFELELRCDSTFNLEMQKRAHAIRGLVKVISIQLSLTITGWWTFKLSFRISGRYGGLVDLDKLPVETLNFGKRNNW
jgi:hypothetical protein